MASKEDLVQSLIIKQSNEIETTAETIVEQETLNKGEIEVEIEPIKTETGQEYVYWARRGENEQLETAGEVEVSSSGVEQENGKIYFSDKSHFFIIFSHANFDTSHLLTHHIFSVA